MRDRFIGWHIKERPEPIFSHVCEVPVGMTIVLPEQLLLSVEPGSLRVVNTRANSPGFSRAHLKSLFLTAHAWRVRPWIKKPKTVTVRLEGTPLNQGNCRWLECSEQVALWNREFWKGPWTA